MKNDKHTHCFITFKSHNVTCKFKGLQRNLNLSRDKETHARGTPNETWHNITCINSSIYFSIRLALIFCHRIVPIPGSSSDHYSRIGRSTDRISPSRTYANFPLKLFRCSQIINDQCRIYRTPGRRLATPARAIRATVYVSIHSSLLFISLFILLGPSSKSPSVARQRTRNDIS